MGPSAAGKERVPGRSGQGPAPARGGRQGNKSSNGNQDQGGWEQLQKYPN